jgi:hypothetical protein
LGRFITALPGAGLVGLDYLNRSPEITLARFRDGYFNTSVNGAMEISTPFARLCSSCLA